MAAARAARATKVNTASVEDYRPTCQLFASTSATTGSTSVCTAVSPPNNTTCKNGTNTIGNDDADGNDPLGGQATIRCWNVPGGCAYVPAGLTCTTSSRARKKTSSTSVSQPYTVITFPNVSASGTTDVPPNYMWWMMQQIYKGNTLIQLYTNTDRNGAAKTAITDLVNSINVTGLPDRVKFGLARYDSGSNGGYVLVPPATSNKAALLAAMAAIPASGGTPLSETLVDVGSLSGRRRQARGLSAVQSQHQRSHRIAGRVGAPVPGYELVREALRHRSDGRLADQRLQQPLRHELHEHLRKLQRR